MPLSSFTLATDCVFAFTKAVADWADITQGDNRVTVTLGELDVEVWDDAYAAVLSVAGGANTTIDLASFTNLAGESVTFTAVLGIVVLVAPAVAADDDVALKLTPGAANGLVWFAGATDGLVLAVNENFVLSGDPEGAGVTIDGTHKTLKFANTGTDAGLFTVVIVGTTL